MAERIDRLKYQEDTTGAQVRETPFFNGPAEFLVQQTVLQLKAVPQWAAIFGEFIDGYKRMDYSIRSLPALRIYNNIADKQFESWFVEGDLIADMILPASVRRNELQQIQDTLSSALLQQFRSTTFFATMGNLVPGLNELGKRFRTDKSLGFQWDEAMVPLTQITINFRLDLRIWDEYLEETLRTKDSPFDPVLKNLDRIVTTIQAMRDDNVTVETTVGLDQPTT
jgi:hypothetical protein